MASELESSILVTIKKMLGMDRNYDAFDTDVVTHINTAMMTLQQLGVGPEEGMFITGVRETWNQFFSSEQMLEAAKTYIFIQVKLIFDPPTSSFVLESYRTTSNMLEQRLKDQARFFDGSKGTYVRRSVEADDPDSSEGKRQPDPLETGRYPVHIERDGITPLDDIGLNTVMRSE